MKNKEELKEYKFKYRAVKDGMKTRTVFFAGKSLRQAECRLIDWLIDNGMVESVVFGGDFD